MTRKRLNPDVLREKVPKQDRGYTEISCTKPTKARFLAYCAGRRPDDVLNELLTKEGVPVIVFRIDPMVPAGLIEVDHSATELTAKRNLLCMDTRDGRVWLTSRCQAENAVPAAEYHGLVLIWTIPALADAKRFAEMVNAGDLDPVLSHIKEGASGDWDGNSTVGILTEDAEEASEEVADWLNALPTMDEPAGLWEPGDWFQDGVPGFKSGMTDDELLALSIQLDAEALRENVVLVDSLNYLKTLRDR